MNRAHFLKGLFAATALGPAAFGSAAAILDFDKAGFQSAIAAGKPVIVSFAAEWCPTCRAQKPIVSELMADARFRDIALFVADFDKELDLRKELRVGQQSTFVVFHGGKEVARSTGQTRRDALAELFAKAL